MCHLLCNWSNRICNNKYDAPVVILPTQDNIGILEKLESGFKRTINWNKYQSTLTKET